MGGNEGSVDTTPGARNREHWVLVGGVTGDAGYGGPIRKGKGTTIGTLESDIRGKNTCIIQEGQTGKKRPSSNVPRRSRKGVKKD